ncbi:MAG: hypothetical protein U1A78_12905 [Polyangia bacterium]
MSRPPRSGRGKRPPKPPVPASSNPWLPALAPFRVPASGVAPSANSPPRSDKRPADPGPGPGPGPGLGSDPPRSDAPGDRPGPRSATDPTAAAPSAASPPRSGSSASSASPGNAPAAPAAPPPAAPPRSGKRSWFRRKGRLAQLAELPGKIPEKIEEGLERGTEVLGKAANVTVDALRDPIGAAQQVVEALQAPTGLVLGWAVALLLPIILYLLDLGAGSLWNIDAEVALALRATASGELRLEQAAHLVPPPTGAPLGLASFMVLLRLLEPSEWTLRLLPALAALGAASCLLAIAIDVGVGRHAGGLAGLVLLAMPLTYQLSHRVLPDMLIAFAATAAVALVSHSLHGHKFDRHILPFQREADEPAPLPLRKLPMLFATLGIGVAALYDPRAGFVAIMFALVDMAISHRYLLRKRRVWMMLLGGLLLTAAATFVQPVPLRNYLHWPQLEALKATFFAVWHQGDTWFGRHVGQVVVVTTGFGLLLGSLRRASRPLLVWIVVATAITSLGDGSVPPRGLGLVLPPLALCAAVGLQSPVRWLGGLGGLITACALAGVVVATVEGAPVLHKNDTIKTLTQSLRHAPQRARRCTVALPRQVPSLYSGQKIEEYGSVRELKQALRPGELFSCLIPEELRDEALRELAPPPEPAPVKPPPRHPKDGKHREPAPPPPEAKDPRTEAIGSVLLTTLDIEEPPVDTQGPRVLLISR